MTQALSKAAATGPAETEARKLLGELFDEEVTTKVTQRSPVGSGALRVRVDRDAAAAASDLEREPWVAAVAARPGGVLYLRIATGALRRWISGGYADGVDLLPAGPSTAAGADMEPPDSLTAFRRTAVTSALAAIGPEREWAPDAIAVGEVDVRYGPLRMRHGGVVGVDDAAEEIGRARELEEQGQSRPIKANALSLPMLATSRNKHLHLDDEWIRRAATWLCSITQALRPADAPTEPDRTDDREPPDADTVRRLAIELEALPRQAALASARLEPAYLARFAIAAATQAHTARLATTDPLRTAVATVLGIALGLLGPEVCDSVA
jgi:hypothetical protein